MRKNKTNDAYGFSKYNQDGQVTYAETRDNDGNLIKHYYEYDMSGRRIHYIQSNVSTGNTFTEYIQYMSNDSKWIYTVYSNSPIYYVRYVDKFDITLISKTVDTKRKVCIVKELDRYRNTYNTKEFSMMLGLFETR